MRRVLLQLIISEVVMTDSRQVQMHKKRNNEQRKSTYKYFAFISYNSRDTLWGKRLQRKLRSMRNLCAIAKIWYCRS